MKKSNRVIETRKRFKKCNIIFLENKSLNFVIPNSKLTRKQNKVDFTKEISPKNAILATSSDVSKRSSLWPFPELRLEPLTQVWFPLVRVKCFVFVSLIEVPFQDFEAKTGEYSLKKLGSYDSNLW